MIIVRKYSPTLNDTGRATFHIGHLATRAEDVALGNEYVRLLANRYNMPVLDERGQLVFDPITGHKMMRQVSNCFDTKEEAEQAIREIKDGCDKNAMHGGE